jgi:hypothetical protein
MKRMFQLLRVLVFAPCISMNAQNAPVTTVGNIFTFKSSVTVPVTAAGFNNIGSCGLQLSYDTDITVATAISAGPLLTGNLNSNLTTPGKIIIGWYTFPGISLPDSTVIFNITFSKVGTGISAITWYDDGYSCYYSDSGYVILNDSPSSNYYINGSVNFQSEAPVTAFPSVKAAAGSQVDIPVRVSGFLDIGKINLTMDYDPSVLAFQSWTNTSGFPGLSVEVAAPGEIFAHGLVEPGGPGMTLSDSSVLFTLHFLCSGGTSGLNWRLEGGACEYAGAPPSYPVLFDEPKASYYLNGTVTPALGTDEPITGRLKLNFYPNPFHGIGTLRWHAPSTGSVSVEICNLWGESIGRIESVVENPGEQLVNVSSNRFVPGIYTLRISLESAGELMTGSMKIIYAN